MGLVPRTQTRMFIVYSVVLFRIREKRGSCMLYCICHVHAHAMHARDVYVITSLIWIDIITVNKIVSSLLSVL